MSEPEDFATLRALLADPETCALFVRCLHAFAVGYARGYARGQLMAARNMLLIAGNARLGPPDDSMVARINGCEDLGRLEATVLRVFHASGWDDLLATL